MALFCQLCSTLSLHSANKSNEQAGITIQEFRHIASEKQNDYQELDDFELYYRKDEDNGTPEDHFHREIENPYYEIFILFQAGFHRFLHQSCF